MTVKQRLNLERALASLKTAQLFLDRGLRLTPEEDKALRLAVLDARDGLALAVDAVAARAK